MHLTQFSDYSLRVLICLGQHSDRLVTIDEIVYQFKVSRNHLVKVVNWLSKTGLIVSHRGKNGGLSLSRTVDKYRLGDLIRETEPHNELVECFNQKTNTCPISGACELEMILWGAQTQFFETLNKYTLGHFLRKSVSTLGRKSI